MLPCILDGAYSPLLIELGGSKDTEAPTVELTVEGAELGVLTRSVDTRGRSAMKDRDEWK